MSDQMKVPGNSAKNVEERNIPWSQQVDEASYENLASPTTDDNAGSNQSSMQFQYPPFNPKESQSTQWNNNKPRKSSNNFENNKKYAKPTFYNSKRDEFQPNAWGQHNSRRPPPTSDVSGSFARVCISNTNRTDEMHTVGKTDIRYNAIAAASEEKKVNVLPAAAAPKKTTWASIASQPAKLASRTTLTTSSQKKKGPGMPPPPMVPGKHNLDVNTWDVPNNNPPPVPSPPPPIDIAYADAGVNFNPGMAGDNDMGAGAERAHKGMDYQRDDNKSNYRDNNYGRVRNSPNGHTRKNWPVQQQQQHPLHHNRQPQQQQQQQPMSSSSDRGGMPQTGGPMRRNEGNMSGGAGGSGSNRYTFDRDRRSHYGAGNGGGLRGDNPQESFRDENSARNASNTQSNDLEASSVETPQAVLEELRDKNNYNPAEIDLEKAASARFFVIKSYSEDDIHRSIKYEIWCSTDHGNKRLDDAFKERQQENGNILLFFSVNGSGHFCGMAQMMTAVDYNSTSSVWSQDKWKGKFKVKWIYVKDVPNAKLRHIRLENNENKSVTNSRDAQEVPNAQGIEVLQILHSFKHVTSIFDDFNHYEKKQEEEVSSKKPLGHENMGSSHNMQSPANRYYGRQTDDRDRDRDGRTKYFGGNNSGGGSFRDRNSIHRSGYNNYNDNRRFDNHRTGGGGGGDRDTDADRENSEYGSRKFDYNRRDDRMSSSKHSISREREFSDDQSKNDGRFRSTAREMQKDNEYPVKDRIRAADY